MDLSSQGGDELLRVDGLKVTLGPATVVNGVSFAITRGRTLCLVGESGCGKSVTARAIMRLLTPPLALHSSSRIVLAGRELTALPEAEMRPVRGRDIAMIFQEPMSSLNPVWRVGDQVAEAIVWHRKTPRRQAMAHTIELFRLVGIPSPERRVDQFPHELSGGMQQRVMIAMALSCDPAVLIADEPTTALDVTIQAQILDLLRELQQRRKMALLLITHDLGVVAEAADDIAVMYAGSLVEAGPADAVLGAPQHPYTEALLQSVPRLGMDRARKLNVIRGMVPSPFDPPPGCRFAERCDHAMAVCAHSPPPLFDAGAQRSACWLCKDGARA
jgi:oligopeptide/dipeptide ABC transporter ATP-binding protein